MKNVILNESQVNSIIEGIKYSNTGKTRDSELPIYFSINSKQDDKSNKNVDTRVFGLKDNIRNGDGSIKSKKNKTLADKVMSANRRIDLNSEAINWVKNGMNGVIRGATSDEMQEYKEKYDEFLSDSDCNEEDAINEMIAWLNKSIDRDMLIKNMYQDKYNRTYGDGDEKIGRYNFGKVPGTNIDVIALFEMNDFNFSDAIKNGVLRQNGGTDKMLRIKKQEREKESIAYGRAPYKKIAISYDNGISPDISNNFSLDDKTINGENGHFKKQYGLNDENYTSISEFIDKSILTASYALKDVNYKPDVLIAAPSSSKFNDYYCINLSRKLGIEYVKKFFDRNVINVKYDEQTEKELNMAGATEGDKEKIRRLILTAIFAEIMAEAKKPIMEFVYENFDVLSNISKQSHSREKCDINLLTSILTMDICKVLVENCINNDKTMTYKNIATNYIKGDLYKNFKDRTEADNRNHIRSQICQNIKLHIGKKRYEELLYDVDSILQKYSDKIASGMRYNFSRQKFKITEIEKRFRPCIHNVYVIADNVLNKSNNELQTKYKNARFLIFDEDINSGATLKLLCDTLMDKIDNGENNIKCLVNAVSLGGR